MAEKRELEIEILKNGEVSVRVKGIAGAKCLDETKKILEALGNVVKSQETTSEYYQQEETQDVTNKTGN